MIPMPLPSKIVVTFLTLRIFVNAYDNDWFRMFDGVVILTFFALFDIQTRRLVMLLGRAGQRDD